MECADLFPSGAPALHHLSLDPPVQLGFRALPTITELRSGRTYAVTSMQQGTQTSPPMALPPIVISQPRDPGTFSGTGNIDVDDWLKMYERASLHNRWDQTVMLANLNYYLKEPALVWYETNEETLTSWDEFKAELRKLFGQSTAHQIAAKNELASRAQSATEPYVSYILDVLALCQKVDRNMAESEKVSHVLKGIADDAFNLLVFKNCTTVDAMIVECRRFEEAKSRRIGQHFARLPNTAATSTCEDQPSRHPEVPPSPALTRLIRREVEAMSPATLPPYLAGPDAATVSLIQTVVRQEIDNLGARSICAFHNTGNCSPCPAQPARRQYSFTRSRNPEEWRTPDDRPICFRCRGVGHIARYCRNRWSSPQRTGFPTYRPFGPPSNQFPSYQAQNTFPADASTPRPSRSPSPRRRQSPSPQARRPPSAAYNSAPSSEN